MNLNEWLRAQWDRVFAVLAVGVGAIALGLGYLGIRDALYPGQQIPYIISGGLVGLTLVGVGGVFWLSADLRDEWRLLEEMDGKLDRICDGLGVEPRESSRPPAVDDVDLEETTASRTTPEESLLAGTG